MDARRVNFRGVMWDIVPQQWNVLHDIEIRETLPRIHVSFTFSNG